MARGITRKELKQDEFVDAAVGAKDWLEAHWRQAAWIGGAVVVVALLAVLWTSTARRAESAARERLGQALHAWSEVEAGEGGTAEIEAALAGFDAVIDRAAGSSAGATAQFYRGAALWRLERRDEAIQALEDFTGRHDAPPTLRGTARALLAQILVDAERFDEAIATLEQLSQDSGTYPTPMALFMLGRVQERKGDREAARRSWQRIVDEFPQSPVAADARQALGTS